MFTEGLEPNALRWVQQDHARSASAAHRRLDPVRGFQTEIKGGGGGAAGVRGFALPRPDKFRSGHLPQAYIPVSRTIPAEEDSVSGGSETEDPTDTEEEEIYGGRYSLDSSPQDDGMRAERLQHQWRQRGFSDVSRVANGFKTPVTSRQCEYSSDTYADLSSSRHPQHVQKQTRQAQVSEFTDEESESGGSLELNSGFRGLSGGVNAPSQRSYPLESQFRSVPFQGGVETDSEKVWLLLFIFVTLLFSFCWAGVCD
ncbi:hypothetical protein Taro_018669, partial [Colocasia esculenta]|nr:hypothetical protein [Colocasia esculenta]